MNKSPKSAKFRELAEKRVDRTIAAIRSIGSLSNTDLYEWEAQEIEEIMAAIHKALDAVRTQFDNPVTGPKHKFKLKPKPEITTAGGLDDDIPF